MRIEKISEEDYQENELYSGKGKLRREEIVSIEKLKSGEFVKFCYDDKAEKMKAAKAIAQFRLRHPRQIEYFSKANTIFVKKL